MNKEKKYPICPQCLCNTVVLFTPPREGIVGTVEGYRTIGTPAYVDWHRAHLYCCNGETNCNWTAYIMDGLTTPMTEDKYSPTQPTQEKVYNCRFHPTDGWHEVGCPHIEQARKV